VQVKSASFENGLLKVDLVREVPEAMKPRRIAINGGPASPRSSRRKQPKQSTLRQFLPRPFVAAGGACREISLPSKI
jgi:hypothetical protein